MSDGEWNTATLKHYLESLIVSLKELVETRFSEREKQRQADHAAINIALRKIEEAQEHRIELLAQFRDQTLEQQKTFITRDEFERLERRYEERHEQMQIDVRLLQARVGPILWVGGVFAVTVIGLVISHIATGTP